MTRHILFTIVILAVSAVAKAEPQTPRGVVIAYECEQIDPNTTGFSCEFGAEGLTLIRHEPFESMTPDRQKLAEYEFAKIALRYMELGGRKYMQRADFWPSDRRRVCYRVDNLPYKISCDDITVSD
ncbi:MAG: hypothetical protein C0613_08300 [Desulfobulbaceae bacterium]|nr:MAG: hypothetical protein C0613_08300 [Desulfobulbaceae bacterium]